LGAKKLVGKKEIHLPLGRKSGCESKSTVSSRFNGFSSGLLCSRGFDISKEKQTVLTCMEANFIITIRSYLLFNDIPKFLKILMLPSMNLN